MLETAPTRASRTRARHRRPRRWRGLIGFILLLAVLGSGLAAAVSYYNWCHGASGGERPVSFVIEKGATSSDIVSDLHAQGVIRCDFVSKLVVRRRGLGESFVAGSYALTTNMPLGDVLTILTTPPPPIETVEFGFPEGFRLTQIAEKAEADLGIPAARFLKLARSGKYALPPYLPAGTPTVEGFLFPARYELVKEKVTANLVIRTLLEEFEEEVASLPWKNARRLGVTKYEVVIIASMIEREVQVEEERALVAAVIYNRLAEGIPLGIDATLQFVDQNPEDGLTESDLAVDSPYNTRINLGLPPTPIASPRLDSIRAALEPADVDYLYYVLCERDGPGRHRFSVGEDEFINNKNECLG